MAESKTNIAKIPAAESRNAPVVVDLGSKSKKKIKQLRRGEGRLLAELDKVTAELVADGTLTEPSQAVVVVVKPKRRRGGLFR
jgi:Family of unknown function (DUF6200)